GAVQRSLAGRPFLEDAVAVDQHTGSGTGRLVDGDHVNPLALADRLLEVRAGAQLAVRVPGIRGDAIGPRRLSAVEAESPLEGSLFSPAEPVDVRILGLAREPEAVRPHPHLHRQAVLRVNAELATRRHLHVSLRGQADRVVRILLDGAELMKRGLAVVGAVV